MADLSPAAQAVMDAAHEAWVTADNPRSIAAAALRAAVDQVAWRRKPAEQLRAIAAELEGDNNTKQED